MDGRRRNANYITKLLYSRDALVLQDTHNHATILGLSFRRLVTAHLVCFSHCPWGQHSGERNVALLEQDIGHAVGAVLTQLLVQFHAADG